MTASFAATVVLPTRNEEGSIGALLREIAEVVDTSLSALIEVLVIDDSDLNPHGVNETLAAVEMAKHEISSPHIVIRHHHRPKGHRPGKLSGAMAEGLRRAQGAVRVYMDSDGQHPPAILPGFLQQIEAGHDIVVGSRYREGGNSDGLNGPLRHIVSRGATALVKVLFPWELRGVSDPMSGCFAVRQGAIDPDRLNPRGFKFLLDVLARHSHLKRAEVPLQFRDRIDGESKAGEGNGKEFLKQVPTLRIQTLPETLAFGLVGGMTAVLGALLLWMFVAMGLNPLVANGLQLGITLAVNFEFYRRWVWSGQTGRLLWQIPWFLLTRGATLAANWYLFAFLLDAGWHYQAANIAGLVGATLLNYPLTKLIFDPTMRRAVRDMTDRRQTDAATTESGTTPGAGRHRRKKERRLPRKLIVSLLIITALVTMSVMYIGGRTTLFAFIVCYAAFNLVTSALEVRWRLYGRRDPEAREAMKFPEPVTPAEATKRFYLIVPALDEAEVIAETLVGLAAQTHPNVRLVVSLSEGDDETIREVTALAAQNERVMMVVRSYQQGSKPLQLNAALEEIDGIIAVDAAEAGIDPAQFAESCWVGVFDAEDDVPVELLVHVEAGINKTNADVVQAGVQLVNLDLPTPEGASLLERMKAKARGWYCVHNDMEYFFWFSSRMFYQVNQGFVPLGGNTVFVRKPMLDLVGGWPLNLTEDCALGVKLSVEHDAKVVAFYEPRLATREETPSRLFGPGSLFRQRERWDQGFLSVLIQMWKLLMKLPIRQRMMALYILGMPLIQATNALMLPVSILALFLLIGPVGLVLVMYAPFVPIVMTLCLQLVGLREFSREFEQKTRLRHYVSLIVGNYPYQLVLSMAALSAIVRYIRGKNDWRLTKHDGNHRTTTNTASTDALVSTSKGTVA